MIKVKSELAEFRRLKDFRMKVNRQDRMIKNGWKDGILGVEIVGDQNSEFYDQKTITM